MKEDKEKKRYDLWLDSLWEFAPKKKLELIREYGDSKRVWMLGREKVRKAIRGGAQKNEEMKTPKDVDWLMEQLSEQKIQAIAWDDEEYPPKLKEISQPPWMLYIMGRRELLTGFCVAVVGARKASEYGKSVAYAMGKRLAQADAVVISGMALGIDAWAHRGALDLNKEGKCPANTAAVLGSGVDICYPASNRRLYEELKARGALISEFRPGVKPKAYYFPMRNRIISGLSQATVVVEAAVGSGSLITAELAAEQGREVFAVPGSMNQTGSVGANKLIKDGAGILISVEDLIHELNLQTDEVSPNTDVFLGADEEKIIQILLQQGEVTSDDIASKTGWPPGKINGLVTILEMKGMVFTAIGKIFLANRLNLPYSQYFWLDRTGQASFA